VFTAVCVPWRIRGKNPSAPKRQQGRPIASSARQRAASPGPAEESGQGDFLRSHPAWRVGGGEPRATGRRAPSGGERPTQTSPARTARPRCHRRGPALLGGSAQRRARGTGRARRGRGPYRGGLDDIFRLPRARMPGRQRPGCRPAGVSAGVCQRLGPACGLGCSIDCTGSWLMSESAFRMVGGWIGLAPPPLAPPRMEWGIGLGSLSGKVALARISSMVAALLSGIGQSGFEMDVPVRIRGPEEH
jgi:hypothetical protein